MLVYRFAALALMCLGVAEFARGASTGRNCHDPIAEYQQCLNQAQENAQKRAASSNDVKSKVEACFTKNGCKKPSPHAGHRHTIARNISLDPNVHELEQCSHDLAEKYASLLQACVQKVVEEYDLPVFNKTAGNVTADESNSSEEEEKESSKEVGGFDIFEEACRPKGDKAAASKCVSEVGRSTKPGRKEMKGIFDERCAAIGQCKRKLGKCDSVLRSLDKAICNCNNQVARNEYARMWKETASCSRLPSKHTTANYSIDCESTPKDICDYGFDTFYRSLPNL